MNTQRSEGHFYVHEVSMKKSCYQLINILYYSSCKTSALLFGVGNVATRGSVPEQLHSYKLKTLSKVQLLILGHSQNFTDNIWPLGQAISIHNMVFHCCGHILKKATNHGTSDQKYCSESWKCNVWLQNVVMWFCNGGKLLKFIAIYTLSRRVLGFLKLKLISIWNEVPSR